MKKNKSRFDVTSLGSTMIRFSVPHGQRLENARCYEVRTAGTESNTLVALSQMAARTAWMSRLNRNSLGQRIVQDIQSYGVDTSHVIWTEKDRNEVFFVEYGSAPRGVTVIYDRGDSAISKIDFKELDLDFLLDTRIFHCSGILPALSQNCRATLEGVIDTARKAKVIVSIDVNYRSKLWSADDARKTLSPMLKKCDIISLSKEDARDVFGINGSAEEVIRNLHKTFKPEVCVVTLGGEGGIAFDGKNLYRCEGYKTDIVDRLGAGDCFTAGLLCGYLEGSIQNGMNYADAMAALKLGVHGDYFAFDRKDVLDLINRSNKREVGR
jgi:2-dehydro-3-deoxygluconokinase